MLFLPSRFQALFPQLCVMPGTKMVVHRISNEWVNYFTPHKSNTVPRLDPHTYHRLSCFWCLCCAIFISPAIINICLLGQKVFKDTCCACYFQAAPCSRSWDAFQNRRFLASAYRICWAGPHTPAPHPYLCAHTNVITVDVSPIISGMQRDINNGITNNRATPPNLTCKKRVAQESFSLPPSPHTVSSPVSWLSFHSTDKHCPKFGVGHSLVCLDSLATCAHVSKQHLVKRCRFINHTEEILCDPLCLALFGCSCVYSSSAFIFLKLCEILLHRYASIYLFFWWGTFASCFDFFFIIKCFYFGYISPCAYVWDGFKERLSREGGKPVRDS